MGLGVPEVHSWKRMVGVRGGGSSQESSSSCCLHRCMTVALSLLPHCPPTLCPTLAQCHCRARGRGHEKKKNQEKEGKKRQKKKRNKDEVQEGIYRR